MSADLSAQVRFAEEAAAESLTLMFAVAVWPLSSETLQVICAGPVEAPVEE